MSPISCADTVQNGSVASGVALDLGAANQTGAETSIRVAPDVTGVRAR
ncbi:MAG: hypothetical protein ABJZ69_10490 [Hyphomicrobiales bacterium]